MLQFLQFKQFGQHKVPDGWVVVAAGNPPEYNKSVKEFDTVTLDRIKLVNVEADYKVWKKYAYEYNVHNAIISYLDINENNFYKVENTVEGKEIVTAKAGRLSQVITMYEQLNIKVKKSLIMQYIQHKDVAAHFANFYELYNKYKNDYNLDDILAGVVNTNDRDKIMRASFDEKLSFLSMLLEKVASLMNSCMRDEAITELLYNYLKQLREFYQSKDYIYTSVLDYCGETENIITQNIANNTIDKKEAQNYKNALALLKKFTDNANITSGEDGHKAFEKIREYFSQRASQEEKRAQEVNASLDNAFKFISSIFGLGQELIIFVTELTYNYHSIRFLAEHPNASYLRYNKELLFDQKEKALIRI
jgi:hypothetical protein